MLSKYSPLILLFGIATTLSLVIVIGKTHSIETILLVLSPLLFGGIVAFTLGLNPKYDTNITQKESTK